MRFGHIHAVHVGVVVFCTGSASATNFKFDDDGAGLFECQGRLDHLALLEGLCHVHEHDVEAAWLQLDGFDRLE